MKADDFDYRITYEENEGRSGTAAYDAEPSLRMIVQKYYSTYFDVAEAHNLTERYIAQMLTEKTN